ncbi:MAG: LysR family transcriptional regulator [Myxococcaceae bacterium]
MNNRRHLPALELDQLPAYGLFALVVKHRSFSEAARLTGLARSAVSQRIARLERRHGVALLRRTTRRVTATEAGAMLFERCARLLEHAEGLLREVDSDRLAGPVRLNAPLSLVNACVRELLVQVIAAHPELTIDLVIENRQVDLLETRDDVVLRVARELSPGTVARRLAPIRMVLAASPAYLATAGVPRHPRELVHHRCLRYGMRPSRTEWRFDGGAITVPAEGPFIVNDGGVLKDLMLDGQGLLILPEYMIAAELRSGAAVRVLEDFALDAQTCWAVLPAGRTATRRAKLVVDFLAQKVATALPRAP